MVGAILIALLGGIGLWVICSFFPPEELPSCSYPNRKDIHFILGQDTFSANLAYGLFDAPTGDSFPTANGPLSRPDFTLLTDYVNHITKEQTPINFFVLYFTPEINTEVNDTIRDEQVHHLGFVRKKEGGFEIRFLQNDGSQFMELPKSKMFVQELHEAALKAHLSQTIGDDSPTPYAHVFYGVEPEQSLLRCAWLIWKNW